MLIFIRGRIVPLKPQDSSKKACLVLYHFMNSQIESVNPVVKAVIEGSAPRPAQLAAARGILPLPQSDLLELLVNLAGGTDAELANHAKQTLASQDTEALHGSISSTGIAASVLAYFAGREGLPKSIHQMIIANAKTPAKAILEIAAQTKNGELLELISLNQQLLINNPKILESILANPNRSSEAERRASEIKREFFEKERGAQQIANELRAKGNEAAAEFIEQGEFADGIGEDGMSIEDALFLAEHIEVPDSETDDAWLGLEYLEELYEETEEQRQAIVNKILGEFSLEEDDLGLERVSMLNRVMKMGMKDRVRLAMKGDREARNILIRDPNRIVAQAVVANPRITEQEIEKIAAMRTVTEDILRQIASNRQWARNYAVMHTLARNPRTPMANVLNILSRLQLRDLAALSKNRNVSDAVRRQAMRLSQARTGR